MFARRTSPAAAAAVVVLERRRGVAHSAMMRMMLQKLRFKNIKLLERLHYNAGQFRKLPEDSGDEWCLKTDKIYEIDCQIQSTLFTIE